MSEMLGSITQLTTSIRYLAGPESDLDKLARIWRERGTRLAVEARGDGTSSEKRLLRETARVWLLASDELLELLTEKKEVKWKHQ